MDLLPDELVQLWSDKAPQQKAVQALCAAIASGDLASVKVHIPHYMHFTSNLHSNNRALVNCHRVGRI
jgi:hypothetical protein